MSETIRILHTNDLHSHFENWPKIRRYLKQAQLGYRDADDTVLTVDLGDNVDRVHPLTEANMGRENVKLMNQIGYDAVTIGNNEGLGLSKRQLDHLYDDANFDVVLGNVLDAKTGKLASWAKPYKLMTTKAGTRVLIMGDTAPYQLTYPLLGWDVLEPAEVIRQILSEMAGQYDIVIMLSHLGLNVDRLLAKQFPELTVIIGSHTHHLLVHGEHDQNSLLAAAGKYGEYIGTVTLTLNEKHEVLQDEASVVQTSTLPEASGDQAEIDGYEALGDKMLSKRRIARLKIPMTTKIPGYSRLGYEGLLALEEAAGVDTAMINTGLFLQDLPAGIIDENQIHKLLPHAMHVMKVTLSGYDVWRLVQEVENTRLFLRVFRISGMGFRGKVFGEMMYDGISYDQDTKAVLWHNEPLNPDADYTIAMLDHYLFIPFFQTINISGKIEMQYDAMLRDVFAEYLAKHYPIVAK